MTSRVPNDDSEDVLRPMLGWEQAIAALQRNFLQQQQQQPQHQNQQHDTTLNQASIAALAAGLTPSASQANGIPSLWPFNLGANAPNVSAPNVAQPAAAAAAASLAALGTPANSYLSHLQNLHNPESLLTFQQNLLLLDQIQQQRQLLAANPHLLMAVAAAQNSNVLISPPSQLGSNNNSNINTLQHPLLMHSTGLQIPASVMHQHQLAHHLSGSPKLNNGTSVNNNGNASCSGTSNSSSNTSGLNGNNSLLTTVNSALTNQHQDSLVDQHFRRSLGEDYNQIMSAKADKINVGK